MIRRLSLLAGALLLVGCAGDGNAAGPEPVEFLVFGEPEEVEAYQAVIDAYESRESAADVTLTATATRGDLLTKLSTSIAAGSPPDLFLMNYRFYGQYAARGELAPVADRFAGSDVFDEEDFYPVALEAFRWGGTQTCLPQNVSSLVVYYNRDLFEAAGVAEPPDEWSWYEMVDAATTLTVDSDGDGTADQHGLGIEPGIARLAPFIWSAGGELVDDPDEPTTFAIDTAPAVLATQRFLELGTPLGIIPNDEEMESEDLESRFMNGRLAMFISSRRVVPQFRTISEFTWDVAPLPVVDEPVNVLHSDAFCMTEASTHQDAAWDFIEFALGPEGQEILAATGRTVPSLRAVAESPAFLDPSLSPASSEVFLDAIPVIRRLPTISTWPEVEDISDGLIEEAMFETPGGEALELIAALRDETAEAYARASDDG